MMAPATSSDVASRGRVGTDPSSQSDPFVPPHLQCLIQQLLSIGRRMPCILQL